MLDCVSLVWYPTGSDIVGFSFQYQAMPQTVRKFNPFMAEKMYSNFAEMDFLSSSKIFSILTKSLYLTVINLSCIMCFHLNISDSALYKIFGMKAMEGGL
jgi:hypothetical protein